MYKTHSMYVSDYCMYNVYFFLRMIPVFGVSAIDLFNSEFKRS